MKPIGINPATLSTPFGIFDQALRQYFGSRLAVLQPVEVASVNGSFANLRPVIAHFDTDGKPITITDNDIIPNVPIVQPFTANGRIQLKVAPGDKGLLFGGNFDISKYKQSHSATTVGSGRQFSWSDGFFMPVDFQSLPAGVLLQSGASKVDIQDSEISITTTKLKITADVEITGNVTATGTLEANGITDTTLPPGVTLGTHTHGSPSPVTPPPTPGS
jgi:hypothetical protein